ncbi:MAG: tsf [Rickettsiaceae bacterium]|jgi:elongation factor Ts|nr:tsf [Rickettsiaceae bacterium]
MAEISAAAIKDLREKTQAGMMDCKKALTECNGNMEEAIDWLRKKGLSAAAKKSGRVAAEGLVAVASDASRGVVIELNSETDFAAKNDKFKNLAAGIVKVAFEKTADIEKLKQTPYSGSANTVEQEVAELVGVVGENMQLRRAAEVSGDVVVSYIHNAAAPNMGKIGVLVAFKTAGDKAKAADFGKKVAMHIAAARPIALNTSDVDPALVERERNIFTEQARASGKPEDVIAKMIEGRVRKYYAEVVLVEQAFVLDGKTPVKDALKAAEKEIGGATEIVSYVRFELGEGIEKKVEDFAAEVAKVAQG